MSKLQELINELCPDGVEYIKVGDVTFYEQPTKYIVKSTNYSDDFNIPVLTAGQSFILGYTNETDGIFEATKQKPVIIFDDFTGAFKWVDFPFKVKSSAMKLITSNEEVVVLRYLYHIMGVIGLTSTEHKRLWLSKYSEIKIPVPPLPVQEEIVRILDKMTDYVTELKAELKARKMQYEYYRDDLLSFSSSVPKGYLHELINDFCPDGIEYKIIDDLFYISRGTVISKQYIACHEGIFPVYSSQTENDGELGRINEYKFDGEYITWTTDGANAGTVFYRNEKFNATNVCGLLKSKTDIINTKFIYYVLSIEAIKYVNKDMDNAKLMSNVMAKIKVPVPPLPVQEEIVRILDKFNSICNDISTGLPAEIEARQKQYEYCRDKLLSFQKLEDEEC